MPDPQDTDEQQAQQSTKIQQDELDAEWDKLLELEDTSPKPPADSPDSGADDIEQSVSKRWWRKVLDLITAQWFLFAMAATIFFAWLYPPLGAHGGPLKPEYTISYGGVAAVFLLSGISLKSSDLKHAFMSLSLQLVVQLTVFGILPALTFAIAKLLSLSDFFPPDILVGLVCMAVLPTTISSCVIITQISGGNYAAAISLAIFSNTIGVFVSPALILLYFGEAISFDFGTVLLKLSLTILLPMLCGQLLRFAFFKAVTWILNKINVNLIQRLILCLFLYTTFCDTFLSDITLSGSVFAATSALIIGLHGLYMICAWTVASWIPCLKYDRATRVAALFCGSQKTLAVGIPLIHVFLDDNEIINVGIATIPILLIHPLQMVTSSAMSGYLFHWIQKGLNVETHQMTSLSSHVSVNQQASESDSDV